MKQFTIFILLNLLLSGFSFAKDTIPSPETSVNPEMALWRVHVPDPDSKQKKHGVGFFIAPNQFVINFQTLFSLTYGYTIEDVVLSQEGTPSISLKISKVVALSPLYDLALLTTDKKVAHWLNLKETPVKLDENLFLPAVYSKEELKQVKKIGPIIWEDDQTYIFPSNYSSFSSNSKGLNWSPVVDDRNQIAGVLHSVDVNVLTFIKAEFVKALIQQSGDTAEKDVGITVCGLLGSRDCLATTIAAFKKLAEEEEHSFAQLRLAEAYFYGGRGVYPNLHEAFRLYVAASTRLIEASIQAASLLYSYPDLIGIEPTPSTKKEMLDMVKHPAEQGYFRAQNALALLYKKGIGVETDLEESLRWLERAANQGHAKSQYELAVAYQDGSGVQKNTEMARQYFELAAKSGYPPISVTPRR